PGRGACACNEHYIRASIALSRNPHAKGVAMTVQETERPAFLQKLPSALFINGQWIEGTSASSLTTANPFDDAVLAEIRQASTADVDAAYLAASEAQPEWAALPPAARTAVLEKAAAYLQANYKDILALLSAESGSAQL